MKMKQIKELISQMTLEEKASICSGADFWHTEKLERLGIPATMVSDGPHGLRKQDEGADHLGIKINGNGRAYEMLKNALSALHDFGLIDWIEYYDGHAPKKKLTKYSLEYVRKK